MTKIRYALAALGGVLAAGTASAETVKLASVVRPAGMTCDETKIIEMKVTAQGRTMEVVTRSHKTIAVIASGADAVTKAKVTYRDYTNPKGEGAELIGSTYMVAFGAAGVSVTRPDGKALGATERRLVEKDNKDVGRPDVFARALVGLAFDKGRRTVVPSDRLAKWESFPQPVDAAMTLTETRGPNAHFKTELSAGDPKAEKFTLTGNAIVERSTGEVISLVGEGTFAAKGASGTMRLSALASCKR